MGYSLPGKLNKIIILCFAVSLLIAFTPLFCLAQSTSGQTLRQDTTDRLGNPPSIAFADSAISVIEGNNAVYIRIKLIEARGEAVTADVVFLNRSSSASIQEIKNFSTQTVSFGKSDSSGTVKTVRITLSDDSSYEGKETATFQLQNTTAGKIREPSLLNVTIQDNDAPDVIITEIQADPDDRFGDANGDGKWDPAEDEFIEFVNNENVAIDISGWTLLNAENEKYRFPRGTIIPSGSAGVIFGGGVPSGNFGGANIFTADALDLNDSEGAIRLADKEGNIMVDVTYGSEAGDNQSITRNPNTDDSFVKHTTSDGSDGSLYSPGTKVDGSPFGANFAMGIRGEKGWRMIASPTQNTSFKDLFGDLWIQGLTGSDAPAEDATVYSWKESDGGDFSAESDMTNNLAAGKGYIVYFFEDNELNTPGVQGGFPKIIKSNETENNSSVTIPVTANDSDNNSLIDGNEGWNLLGNPFGTDISVDAVLAALEAVDSNVNANVSIWDHSAGSGNGGYINLGSGDTIAPFQAFWIRYTNASGVSGTATFAKNDLAVNREKQFYKQKNGKQFSLTLSLNDGDYYDEYHIEFSQKGSLDLDRHDAYKLFSLKENSLNLYSLISSNKLMKNALPIDLEASIEIPISFDAPNRESLHLDWEGIEKMPDSWKVMLVDQKLNKEIDLRTVKEYSFTVPESESNKKLKTDDDKLRLNKTKSDSKEPRFVLSVDPVSSEETSSTDIPESVKLNPNYPNPFNPATTISYELKEDSEVLLSVWNIVGQKVVTLVDGVKEAGEHTATWNASEMPSGIYIAQLEVGGQVFIRKMTLIK